MKNINMEHPEYIAKKAMWRKYRDLYAGGEQLKANAPEYLEQRQKEPADVYAERLNRVFYENPEVDRLIDAAASAPDDVRRRALYARAQQLIAEDVPYIGLWYKTNVAVFQPDIHGVQLSPIADFTFLKDVYRQAR